MIVRIGVGVESIRLLIPNCLVRINADDPARAVRKTNSTRFEEAPRSNWPNVAGKIASPAEEIRAADVA